MKRQPETPAHGADGSSGQKRKAASPLDLSLGSVGYGMVGNVDSCAPATPPEEEGASTATQRLAVSIAVGDVPMTVARAHPSVVSGAAPPDSSPRPSTALRSTQRRRSNASSSGSGNGSSTGGSGGGDSDETALARADGNILANPPYPWATNRVAILHSFAELSRRGITAVEGESQCRRCDARQTISYNIKAKFDVLADFIRQNITEMHERAPVEWSNPAVPDCANCGQKNSMRPVIPAEKENINWLFLLLDGSLGTLGLCTLDQLKHFCAHTKQHRTGAKDRVLFLTYLELCNQLYPGQFDANAMRQNRGGIRFH